MQLLSASLITLCLFSLLLLASLLVFGAFVAFYIELFIVHPLTLVVPLTFTASIIWLIIQAKGIEIATLKRFVVRASGLLVILTIANIVVFCWLSFRA